MLGYLLTKIKKQTLFILQNKQKIFWFITGSRYKHFLFVLFEDFNRFITDKAKAHGKQHPWWYCLQCFRNANY